MKLMYLRRSLLLSVSRNGYRRSGNLQVPPGVALRMCTAEMHVFEHMYMCRVTLYDCSMLVQATRCTAAA